jgi:hypothetical protein
MAVLGRNSQRMLIDERVSSEVLIQSVSTEGLLTRCELCVGEIAFLYYELASRKFVCS